jgi:hypothetical protein
VITDIVLTAALQEQTEIDYEDLNTDVIVNFDNGDQYIATFFSHKSLKNMFKNDMLTGEFFSSNYYRVLNAVLVKDFNNGDLLPVIEYMIAEGDFQLIFKKL